MLLIRVIILMIFPIIFSCAGMNSSYGEAYTFDGIKFSPTSDNLSNSIWVRSGHFPSTAKPVPGSASADRLPPGIGAVAGICYRQTTGGKMAAQSSFTPYHDEQITFRSKSEGVSVTRTDKNGYFMEYLPTGEYELFCRGVRTEFRIKQGETTLVPIRGGKRMAD
jgi:hypothetical protein